MRIGSIEGETPLDSVVRVRQDGVDVIFGRVYQDSKRVRDHRVVLLVGPHTGNVLAPGRPVGTTAFEAA